MSAIREKTSKEEQRIAISLMEKLQEVENRLHAEGGMVKIKIQKGAFPAVCHITK